MDGVYELFFFFFGLNYAMRTNLIKKACEYEKLAWRSIFLVTIPDYGVDEIIIQACKELGILDVFLAKDWEGVNACDLPDVIIPHYSFAQLQNYKSHMSLAELSCYGTMHQVDNEEILILECQQMDDAVQLRRKKRIRLA